MMKTSPYISAVIRCRLWVLAIWAAVVVSSTIVYVSNFRIDNSVAIWFLEDDPELELYRTHNSEFGEQEWTYVWLRGESVFSTEFLRDLRLLSDRIKSHEDVTRVLSLAEIEVTDINELRRMTKGNPRFEGRLLSRGDDRFTILAMRNANRIYAIDTYRIQLINEIREAAGSYPEILDFGIVGTTVINSELNRAAKRDMLIYYALIAVFVLIGGGLTLRRARDLVTLCAVVLGAILPIMGCIAALNLPFNLMTVMLPTLLVTVSVSYLIHFISEFHANRAERLDTAAAISATFKRLLRPGLWTSVTTAIGFSSLILSPVAPIRHIGIFAALGIGVAWLNTITVAPALLSFLWPTVSAAADEPKQKSGRLLSWLERPHAGLALLLGSAMIAGGAGLVWLKADTDYVKFFRPGSTVRSDYDQLSKLGMPSSYLTVTVKLAEGSKFADLERHQAMRSFEKSLRSLPGVLDVLSLDEVVVRFASVNGGANALERILVMAESGELDGTDEFLSEDGRRLQLRVMTGPMSTRDINRFRHHLERRVGPAGSEVALLGTNVLWANMDAHVIRTQMLSIGFTAVAVLVLLPLVFRSLVLGVMGFVVSFVPVLCTLGLMGWLGLPVNIATCILGGVVIGLAVDDTIYFLTRVRDGLASGLAVDGAVRRATWTTGRAMIKTSLILTGGFLTMTASDFMPSVYFGVFFAFSILVALLADLIVLPVLLRIAQPLLR
ncbi:MAG: putative RND superfamily exporter protein [Verrucomicrobiales bacterium]|jgi:predicted RND superfamily exporter protein